MKIQKHLLRLLGNMKESVEKAIQITEEADDGMDDSMDNKGGDTVNGSRSSSSNVVATEGGDKQKLCTYHDALDMSPDAPPRMLVSPEHCQQCNVKDKAP